MARVRIVVFVVFSMLAVAWPSQVASAQSSSMSFWEDFIEFYDCWSYWPVNPGVEYYLNCEQDCEDNPFWYWDAEEACDDFCPTGVADFAAAECITDCRCIIPE